MKILVINWQDIRNPLGGGAEVHCHEIFKRIVAAGHTVVQLSCGFEGAASEEIIDGIRIVRRGARNTFNFFVPSAYKQLSREGFDLVIDDVNKIPFYTPLYVKEPLLAISHHFFGKSIYREADFISASYVYVSEMLVNLVYKSTHFAVVSESTRQEFLARGFRDSQLSIIRNAVEHRHFPMKVAEKSSDPIICYFSRVKKYKSPDHLLRAFVPLLKTYPKAQLWFMGSGDFVPELQKMSRELGVESSVTFFGRVSEEQKIELLSAAWCVVNTSMKEGWGITNIEANACGTPAIAANVPGLRDSVSNGQSGLLYSYGNVEELSSVLSEFCSNSSVRAQLSQGAVEWARSFSWDEEARKMMNLCEQIIDSRKVVR